MIELDDFSDVKGTRGREGMKMTARAASRFSAASAAVLLALGLAGCVTTETVSNNGALPAGGSSSDREVSAVTSQVSPAEEKRRRARIRLELSAGHYQQGNLPLALQEIEQALKIDPDYAAGHGMAALVYAAMNDRAKADESFRKGLRLAPRDAELNNNYGWYLCQTGRQAEAIPHFDVAAEDRTYPTPAKPMHNAGICLLQIGDDSAAENYLLRSFKLDPANAVAMYNLSELYLKRGNHERARFYSDRLLATYQPTAETLWLAIRVARLGNDENTAQRLTQQLNTRFPQSPQAARLNRPHGHDGAQ